MKPRKKESKQSTELASVVHRNIAALLEIRREHERSKTKQERISDRLTRFIGSLPMAYVNLVLVLGWILFNSGIFPVARRFDPYPYSLLALLTSVEAIFLATFVLISQNRASVLAEKRADLDVQINLLSEHEITRLIQMVEAISIKMGVQSKSNAGLDELKRDVAPEAVVKTIEKAEKDSAKKESA